MHGPMNVKLCSLVANGTSRYFEDTQTDKNRQWQLFFCIFHSLLQHVSALKEAIVKQIRHKRYYYVRCI